MPRETFVPEDETPERKTDDGTGTGGRLRGPAPKETPPQSTDAFKPVDDTETLVEPKFKKTPKSDKSDDVFDKPLPDSKDGGADENKDGATLRLPLPKLRLDQKITWRAEPQRTRIPFHAKIVNATVSRRTSGVDSDWTSVPSRWQAPQVAKR